MIWGLMYDSLKNICPKDSEFILIVSNAMAWNMQIYVFLIKFI